MVSPDTKRVLVVINKNTMGPENLKFGLPKGHVEGSERIPHCAMRELKEETGLISRVGKTDECVVVSETTYYLIKAHRCLEPSPQDNTEIGDSRWVTWEDIMTTDCNRGLRLIRDKIQKKGSELMKRLQGLKTRKIGKTRNKPDIVQKKGYEENVATHKPNIRASDKDEWWGCDDTDLP